MTKIQLTKSGFKAVMFIQVVEGSVGFLCNNVSQTLTSAEANRIYTQYISNGWTVKSIPEKPSMAPQEKVKPMEKPKQTRDEALTEKYGDINKRREYVALKVRATKAAKEDIYAWVKSHHRLTREQYLDQLKKGTARYLAQYQAEMTAM